MERQSTSEPDGEAVPPQLASRLSSIRAKARATGQRIILIGLVATLALTAAAWWLLDQRRSRLDRDALLDVAIPAAAGLHQRLRSNLEVVRATGAFVAATGPVLTEARFRDFTTPLLRRHPAVYALEWAPRVEHAARDAFEAQVSAASGRDFRIVEPAPDGRFRPARASEHYHPLLYEEPPSGALGLNIGYEEIRSAYIREAVESGEISISGPFRLAEKPEGANHVAVYMPVSSPPGLAILVLNIESLFEAWRRDIRRPEVEARVRGRETIGGRLQFGDISDAMAERWEEKIPVGQSDLQIGFAAPWGFGGGGQLAVVGTVGTFLLGLALTGLAWGLDRVRSLRVQVEKAKELGQYVVERKLGQGAMGVVFLARHALMKRPTALKLMLSQDAKSIGRFEREVTLSCQISHPNIVALYDYGRTEDGLFYYAMEYLPGIDLHSLITNHGPIKDGRAVHFLLQLARGLREAHAAGVVHRDIKPGNLLVTRIGTQADVLKILDFGLVKPVEEQDSPDAGRVVGTPLYMSPEAIRTPDQVAGAADTYAFGCVAHHLLSGRPPFIAGTVRGILTMHLESPAVDLREVAVHPVSDELAQLVEQCLAKDPEGRPTDDELIARLSTMPVRAPWSDWDAAQWWTSLEAGASIPTGETTSLHEVTVMRRRALD